MVPEAHGSQRNKEIRGLSLVVKQRSPKPLTGVRFPQPLQILIGYLFDKDCLLSYPLKGGNSRKPRCKF